jgi:hypothetical protein
MEFATATRITLLAKFTLRVVIMAKCIFSIAILAKVTLVCEGSIVNQSALKRTPINESYHLIETDPDK